MKKNSIVETKTNITPVQNTIVKTTVNKPIQQLFSHGKLLLTGEYMVLLGAKALALPLRFGQTMTIYKTGNTGMLLWNALQYNKVWFSCSFQLAGLSVLETTDIQVATQLQHILSAAKELNLSFLSNTNGLNIATNINFNRDWGFGTSSSLLVNIAQWADVNPYTLHWKVSDGSGYDIACARETQALIYAVENRQPKVKLFPYNPPFKENMFFVYLGKKQVTEASIKDFARDVQKYKDEVTRISEITELFSAATTLEAAIALIDEHEKIIAGIIGIPPVKERLFPDFSGTVKSLGAWGGDFVMAITEIPKPHVYGYFRKMGLNTVFTFNEVMAGI
jgi:mevalonate kinase